MQTRALRSSCCFWLQLSSGVGSGNMAVASCVKGVLRALFYLRSNYVHDALGAWPVHQHTWLFLPPVAEFASLLPPLVQDQYLLPTKNRGISCGMVIESPILLCCPLQALRCSVVSVGELFVVSAHPVRSGGWCSWPRSSGQHVCRGRQVPAKHQEGWSIS